MAVVAGCASVHKSASRTLKRRLQRQHTKLSYLAAKKHLLDLLQPVPAGAIAATALEEYRAELYGVDQSLVLDSVSC